MSPILSQLYDDGYMEAVSVPQTSVFEAAEKFARIEGILPAPESSHAIKVAIDEAMRCKETGEDKTIVFGLTGTGYFDLVAYEKFHDGKMDDYIPTDEELAKFRAKLPKVDGALDRRKHGHGSAARLFRVRVLFCNLPSSDCRADAEGITGCSLRRCAHRSP